MSGLCSCIYSVADGYLCLDSQHLGSAERTPRFSLLNIGYLGQPAAFTIASPRTSPLGSQVILGLKIFLLLMNDTVVCTRNFDLPRACAPLNVTHEYVDLVMLARHDIRYSRLKDYCLSTTLRYKVH